MSWPCIYEGAAPTMFKEVNTISVYECLERKRKCVFAMILEKYIPNYSFISSSYFVLLVHEEFVQMYTVHCRPKWYNDNYPWLCHLL